jgi:hypothetical protein
VLVDNVNRVVGERQVNIDLREAREEFVHDRYDVEASEDDRRRHRQRPPRDGVLPGGLRFRLVDLFQDALARGYVGEPRLGQRQFPRRADQQLGVEVRLQVSDLPTDGR